MRLLLFNQYDRLLAKFKAIASDCARDAADWKICRVSASNGIVHLHDRTMKTVGACPRVAVNLGACYLNGLGCERDLAMAFTCFKSAADLGHPEGMDSLAAAYALGHGVEKDMEKSAVWRMRAKAVRGDEAARKWIEDRKRLKDGK